MNLKSYITLILLLVISSTYAQVGIGTTSPNVASMLDITSTNSGLLIPRVALTSASDVTTIVSPVTSLLVYNSGFSPNGYYYWNGTLWVLLATGNNTDWSLTGNSGTNITTNFIGTTDDKDIIFKRNNARAGYIGDSVYDLITFNSNNGNTSFGANTMLNPTVNVGTQTGVRNTGFGVNVMPGLSTGVRNVGIGEFALFSNTTGTENTALGSGALFSNIAGKLNVAIGRNALTSATTDNNTAVGSASLRLNSSGANNTALGFEALRNNVSGSGNVGIGYQAGRLETGSNKLYIANTNADASNALIYGEFDNKIVRVNGTLQISNPASAPGYALPNVRGTNGQVLQTNGAGATSWVDGTSLSITETDPQVSSATSNAVPKWNGTTLVDGILTDDGTNVGVGVTPSAGNKLEVNGKTKTTNLQMTNGATANYVLQSDATGNGSWALPNNTLSVVRTNLSGNQSLGTTGWQKLSFDTVVFDSNSEFNTSTNQFVATKTGYYEINAGFHTFNQSDTNYYGIAVYKNGSEYQETSAHHYGINLISRTINCLISLNVGDYIEIYAHNVNSGTTIDGFTGKTYFEVKQIK